MTHPYDWNVDSSRQVIQDEWIDLRSERCLMPDGTVVEPYYVLNYPDWVNIMVLTDNDELVMIRQYRHGAGRTLLEIPCGSVDSADENPLAAARRELLEETGFECENLRHTGTMYTNASSHSNLAHTFVGTGARRVGQQNLDASEQIEVELVPLEKIYAALHSDELFPTSMQVTIYAGLHALGRLSL